MSESAPAPLSLRNRLRAALDAAGLAPNHRLGQNFMVDGQALDQLLQAAALQAGETVVEIGPGTGFLSERLLAAGVQLCAVELDRGLHAYLSERFAAAIAAGQLTLIHGDALASKTRFHPAIEAAVQQTAAWSLVSNLPYDISIPALLNALTFHPAPRCCAVTVQYEAARRLLAAPGSDNWGASAAVAQAAGSGKLMAKLPPQCFYPPPRVDSAIIRWQVEASPDAGFCAWCRQIFAYRRKVLRRALRDLGHTAAAADALVAENNFALDRRVEQLTVSELQRLYAAARAQKASE